MNLTQKGTMSHQEYKVFGKFLMLHSNFAAFLTNDNLGRDNYVNETRKKKTNIL